MKKGFIIEYTSHWNTKDGIKKTLVSYYQGTKGRIFRFNSLVGDKAAAKFYEKKVLALHDMNRFFHRASTAKVIPHEK